MTSSGDGDGDGFEAFVIVFRFLGITEKDVFTSAFDDGNGDDTGGDIDGFAGDGDGLIDFFSTGLSGLALAALCLVSDAVVLLVMAEAFTRRLI